MSKNENIINLNDIFKRKDKVTKFKMTYNGSTVELYFRDRQRTVSDDINEEKELKEVISQNASSIDEGSDSYKVACLLISLFSKVFIDKDCKSPMLQKKADYFGLSLEQVDCIYSAIGDALEKEEPSSKKKETK